MELLPAVTAWLDSRTRVLKKQVTDLVTDPVGHVEKQSFNAVEDASNFVDKSREDPMAWVEVLAGNGMVGAFRPVGSKLLPSVLKDIKTLLTPSPSRPSNLSGDIIDKISDKALQKYGASDFPLDPFLGHVKGSPYGTPDKLLADLFVEKVPMSSYGPKARSFTELAARTKRLVVAGKREPSYLDERLRIQQADIYAYRDSLATKEPLFKVGPLDAAVDLRQGSMNLAEILQDSKFTPDQLSKKSLEQLVSIGKKVEAAQLKEASVIKDFTVSRSAQLNKEQGLPKGFVELKTQQDLGAETEFMNNCVGAGGAHPQTGKFLPKWHPITGEQITKGFAEDSGDQYWKRLQSGNERIFSYRPEGLPVATIRMDTRTGDVIEALGVENRPIPESMAREIKRFTDQKRGEFLGFPLAYKYRQMGSMDARRWDVPLELEALLRPHGPGFVQRAEWNRQDNLRRFQQFEAGDWLAE
jgi:hypothetical protein